MKAKGVSGKISMPQEFDCPSCSAPMKFEGGESIFQTCGACMAPIVVPADIYYRGDDEKSLASEKFASLVNDPPVDVERVTNELTPGEGLPDDAETIDPEARIEKFEVYQEKIGTPAAAETKKAVDEIISPGEKFRPGAPYQSPFDEPSAGGNEEKVERKSKRINAEPVPENEPAPLHPVVERVRNELEAGNRIEAVRIFREKFGTDLRAAIEAVDTLARGRNIDPSKYS